MNKKEWRRIGKQTLNNLSRDNKDSIQTALYQHLFKSDLWKNAKMIGMTISQEHEWSTYPIIDQGWREHKQVVVPKCIPKTREMDFYKLEDYGQLETVYFGLKEPDPAAAEKVKKEEIHLLLVPGLLFDNCGYRIGYGGGYYDRFLEEFDGETIMIASEVQKVSSLPIENFDQRVDHILTERGLFKTRQP
ncbi:5-formyltetrahydrofolate cyclo-ligase [Halobacillus sp. B29]|uniref:5-formyltetrahydrofolate cyclo-ligase n=1 Tax=Halobacillus sp. B29 TaxID=3457432 RepID=UPI003FCD18A6